MNTITASAGDANRAAETAVNASPLEAPHSSVDSRFLGFHRFIWEFAKKRVP